MKKPVVCSNLMMRFYKRNGWTKEELDRYCIRGTVHCAHPEDASPYFTLAKGSFFDCVKRYELVSHIDRHHSSMAHMSDVQYMEYMQ